MEISFGSFAEAMEVAYGDATNGVPTGIRDKARSYVWNFLETLSNRKIWWDVDEARNVTLSAFEAIERNKEMPQKTPKRKAYSACRIWHNKFVDYVRKSVTLEKQRQKWTEKLSAQAMQRGGINARELRQWFDEHRKQAIGKLREDLDDIADKYDGDEDEEIAAKRGLSKNTIRARRSSGYKYLREKASEEGLILSDFVAEYFC